MRGIRLRNLQIGDTEWVLEADTASVFRERKTVVAERMEIDFFDGPRHVSRLTADQGVLNQATDDLEARGHVRVISDEGAVLTTEVLFWDHQRAKIHTEEYVEITQGSDVLAGYGLEADPGLDRVEIRRQVRGTLRSAPDSLLSNTRGAAP
jgi:LPS export ABC transporter protein LptC